MGTSGNNLENTYVNSEFHYNQVKRQEVGSKLNLCPKRILSILIIKLERAERSSDGWIEFQSVTATSALFPET